MVYGITYNITNIQPNKLPAQFFRRLFVYMKQDKVSLDISDINITYHHILILGKFLTLLYWIPVLSNIYVEFVIIYIFRYSIIFFDLIKQCAISYVFLRIIFRIIITYILASSLLNTIVSEYLKHINNKIINVCNRK